MMSDESCFEDVVKICAFYSDESLPLRVDYENRFVLVGDYAVEPLMEGDVLAGYVVDPPVGPVLTVLDLDDFFQKELAGWEVRD